MCCPVSPARTRIPSLLRVVLGVLLCSAARADGWHGTLVMTSDYVQRGISQTNGNPALQGSIAFWHPTGWYAGAWASNVETAHRYYTPTSARAELNLFAGYSLRLDPDWVFDARAVHYLYPADSAPVSYDYDEVTFSAAWRERLYASFSVSPNTTLVTQLDSVRKRTTTATELSLQQPLSPWLTLIVGVGYRDLSTASIAGYYYGAASLAIQLRRITLELGQYRTSNGATQLFGPRLGGSRTVGTVSVSF